MPRCSLRWSETGSGGGDAGLGVAGDGGVAIEDEVAMGDDAGGVDLCANGRVRQEEQTIEDDGGAKARQEASEARWARRDRVKDTAAPRYCS